MIGMSLTFHLDVPFGETPAETRFSLERWASSHNQGIFQGFFGVRASGKRPMTGKPWDIVEA